MFPWLHTYSSLIWLQDFQRKRIAEKFGHSKIPSKVNWFESLTIKCKLCCSPRSGGSKLLGSRGSKQRSPKPGGVLQGLGANKQAQQKQSLLEAVGSDRPDSHDGSSKQSLLAAVGASTSTEPDTDTERGRKKGLLHAVGALDSETSTDRGVSRRKSKKAAHSSGENDSGGSDDDGALELSLRPGAGRTTGKPASNRSTTDDVVASKRRLVCTLPHPRSSAPLAAAIMRHAKEPLVQAFDWLTDVAAGLEASGGGEQLQRIPQYVRDVLGRDILQEIAHAHHADGAGPTAFDVPAQVPLMQATSGHSPTSGSYGSPGATVLPSGLLPVYRAVLLTPLDDQQRNALHYAAGVSNSTFLTYALHVPLRSLEQDHDALKVNIRRQLHEMYRQGSFGAGRAAEAGYRESLVDELSRLQRMFQLRREAIWHELLGSQDSFGRTVLHYAAMSRGGALAVLLSDDARADFRAQVRLKYGVATPRDIMQKPKQQVHGGNNDHRRPLHCFASSNSGRVFVDPKSGEMRDLRPQHGGDASPQRGHEATDGDIDYSRSLDDLTSSLAGGQHRSTRRSHAGSPSRGRSSRSGTRHETVADELIAPDGMVSMSTLLQARRVLVNASDSAQTTALHLTAVVGDERGTRALLAEGANRSAVTADGELPLDVATNKYVRRLLLPVDVAVASACMGDAATGNGGSSQLRSLLGQNESTAMAASAMQNDTMLTMHRHPAAVLPGSTDASCRTLQERIAAGIVENTRTGLSLRTPLHMAAAAGDLGVTQTLIEGGEKVADGDNNGWTALHIAAAGINHPGNSTGYSTELSVAAAAAFRVSERTAQLGSTARTDGAEGLDQTTASYGGHTLVDSTGREPSQLLQRHMDVVQLLLDHGAAIDARTSSGKTALHLAALRLDLAVRPPLGETGEPMYEHGMTMDGSDTRLDGEHVGKMLRLLVSSGSDLNAADEMGDTPLHLAARKVRVVASAGVEGVR